MCQQLHSYCCSSSSFSHWLNQAPLSTKYYFFWRCKVGSLIVDKQYSTTGVYSRATIQFSFSFSLPLRYISPWASGGAKIRVHCILQQGAFFRTSSKLRIASSVSVVAFSQKLGHHLPAIIQFSLMFYACNRAHSCSLPFLISNSLWQLVAWGGSLFIKNLFKITSTYVPLVFVKVRQFYSRFRVWNWLLHSTK